MRLLLAFAVLLTMWIAFAQGEEHVGDNGPAIKAEISDPIAIAIDGSRVLYVVAERFRDIRRVDLKSGIITTLQTKAKLEAIDSLAMDAAGNLIATEFTVDRVIRVDPRTGAVTTVAGGTRHGFSGDGGNATNAGLSRPSHVAVDAANNIYFSDMGNRRIRRVDANTGIINTVAGSGKEDSTGDGGSALEAGLDWPNSVAVDPNGSLYIAHYGYGPYSHRIRRVDAKTGIITTVAGSAKEGLAGDGGPAFTAGLESPSDLLFDKLGNLYVVDPVNGRVRYIDLKTQIIKTLVGSDKGFGGDGGPATLAHLNNPSSIAMDLEGNLYIADYVNHRIRRVDAHTGVIQTIAGNGLPNHPHSLR